MASITGFDREGHVTTHDLSIGQQCNTAPCLVRRVTPVCACLLQSSQGPTGVVIESFHEEKSIIEELSKARKFNTRRGFVCCDFLERNCNTTTIRLTLSL